MTTHDQFINSMTPKQKKEYEKEYREFLITELLLALQEEDLAAAKELAKIINSL